MHKNYFQSLITLLFVLLLPGRSFSQAGIDKWAPDDLFAPIQNQYYQMALSSLQLADNEVSNISDQSVFIKCLDNIEKLYKIEGNYAGALELLTGIPERSDASPTRQFDTGPAFTMNMQQVISQVKKEKHSGLLLSRLYYNLSEIYGEIGDSPKALAYQLQCREILKKERAFNGNEFINASIVLGEKYISADEIDSAAKMYKLIEKEPSLHKNVPNYTRYLYLKALLSQRQHKLYDAINIYKQIFSDKGQRPQYYEMALNLGRLYSKTGQYQLADSVLGRNFSALHQLGYRSVIFDQMAAAWCENLLYLKKTEQASKTLIGLARWMIYKTHINSIGLSENEELSYAKRIEEILNVLYTILSNNNNKENQELMPDVLSVELQYRNLVLLNKKELRRQSEPKKYYYFDKKTGTYKPAPGIKEIIAHEYSLPYNKRHLNADSLEELSEQSDRKMASSGFKRNPYENTKSNAISIVTEAGTANIEFVRFIYKTPYTITDSAVYAAFIFGQSFSAGNFIPLCGEEQIIKLMKDENGEQIDEDQLSDVLYSSTSKYAVELYGLIWAPLHAHLIGINDINYSPTGLLNNISAGALFNGKNYISDQYTIRFFSSLTEAGIHRIDYEKPVSVNIWTNIDYNTATYSDGSFIKNNNPAVQASVAQNEKQKKDADTSAFYLLGDYEIKLLKKACLDNHITPESCELNYATEDSFKNAAHTFKGVLHISTHGFYIQFNKQKKYELLPGNFLSSNKNALFRSGLAFSGANYYWKKGVTSGEHDDGILNSFEIEQLDLHNVQLVTLSACETALGDSTYNQGNLGLQRAFKLAGAHYVLVSLWRVNPKTTADLLSAFYNNWFAGQPMTEALKNAQDTIRKDHPSPYSWAGFVLIE